MKRYLILIISIALLLLTSLISFKVKAASTSYEGYILLDVQRHGEAYYIYHGEKYYLGRPTDAFRIMTKYGMGAPSRIIDSIPTGTLL